MMDINRLIFESLLLSNDGKYVEAIEKLNQAWCEIPDKNNQISEQFLIQYQLGSCYLELIKRSKGTESFVKQANENFLAAYEKLSQLSDEDEEEKKNGKK